MPIQLNVWERRDSADREDLANAALDFCRRIRASEGIRSSRFYWYPADTVVILTEGEPTALDTTALDPRAEADVGRAALALADLAKLIMSWRLVEPGAAEEAYRRAGR